jgi:hypothetical protein
MRTAIALFLLSAACLHADVTVTQRVEGPGMPGSESTMKIKGGKMRVEANPMGYSLIDGATGDVATVMPAQKMVMKMPAAMLKRAVQNAATNTPVAAAKLTPTGRKETINGFACEEYTTEFSGMKAALWLSKDVPNYRELLGQMLALGAAVRRAASTPMDVLKPEDYNGYPVRSVMETPSGNFTSTVVVLKNDPIPDSEFEIPADFKTTEMPMGPQGK